MSISSDPGIHVQDNSSAAAQMYATAVHAQLQQRELDQRERAAGASSAMQAAHLRLERDRFNAEPDREERRAQLQLELHQGQITQREVLDHQRRQNQIGAIRAAIDNGQLHPEDAKNTLIMLQTGVDMHNARAARLAEVQQQLQIDHGRRMAAEAQAHESWVNGVRANGLNSMAQPLYNQGMLAHAQTVFEGLGHRPDVARGMAQAHLHSQPGGILGYFAMDPSGKIIPIERGGAGSTEREPSEAGGQTQGPGRMTPQERQHLFDLLTRAPAGGQAALPIPQLPLDATPEQRDSHVRAITQHSRDFESHVMAMENARGANAVRPETQAAQETQAVFRNIGARLGELPAAMQPEVRRMSIAQGMFQRWGGVDRMPNNTRIQFNVIRQMLESVPLPAQPPGHEPRGPAARPSRDERIAAESRLLEAMWSGTWDAERIKRVAEQRVAENRDGR